MCLQTVLDVYLYSLPEPFSDLNQLPAQAFKVRLSGLWPIELGYVISEQGDVLGTMEYVLSVITGTDRLPTWVS